MSEQCVPACADSFKRFTSGIVFAPRMTMVLLLQIDPSSGPPTCMMPTRRNVKLSMSWVVSKIGRESLSARCSTALRSRVRVLRRAARLPWIRTYHKFAGREARLVLLALVLLAVGSRIFPQVWNDLPTGVIPARLSVNVGRTVKVIPSYEKGS
jgi:hypothetical protein